MLLHLTMPGEFNLTRQSDGKYLELPCIDRKTHNDFQHKQTNKSLFVNISQLIHKDDQGQDGERWSISSEADWPIPSLYTHLTPATHL